MVERYAQVTPPKQEIRVPEYNTLEKFNKLLYRLGKLTARSRIVDRGKPINKRSERPLSSRAQRAHLYREARKIRREMNKVYRSKTEDKETALAPLRRDIHAIFDEARARDEIARQYLHQGEITVNLPGLGEQTARYTKIDPPASRRDPAQEGKPPIFLIPGISNDIDCVGALAQELPYQGRSVVVVGFPESVMGNVTTDFAHAVETSPTYEPHAAFYKEALKELLAESPHAELWGFSTGAPIAAQMLADPELQEKITDAVLISPASVVDQSTMQLNIGVAQDSARLLKRLSSLGKYTLTLGGRAKDVPEEQAGQREIKKATMGSLLSHVRSRFNAWDKARVQNGGSIVVVSGGKDYITKSYKDENVFRRNPQMSVLRIPDGFHAYPLVEPASVVDQVFIQQRIKRQRS